MPPRLRVVHKVRVPQGETTELTTAQREVFDLWRRADTGLLQVLILMCSGALSGRTLWTRGGPHHDFSVLEAGVQELSGRTTLML